MNESHSEKKALEVAEKINKWVRKCVKFVLNTQVGKILTITVKIALCAVVFFFVFKLLNTIPFLNKIDDQQDSSIADSSDSSSEETTCNTLGINLHGTLLTFVAEHSDNDPLFNYNVTASEKVTAAIKKANDDDKIKSIVVEIDSPGGLPVAAEEIANALKGSKKTTVALIRQTGASAAYWAATGAEKIFASSNSDVGSIGVTSSYLDNTNKNKKDGYQYIQLSAGQFKDTGNPDKPISQAEKDLVMRDINKVYRNFISTVSKNRNIPIDKVEAMADGSTMLGTQAKVPLDEF
jgi:signal peptide peptidase SppA